MITHLIFLTYNLTYVAHPNHENSQWSTPTNLVKNHLDKSLAWAASCGHILLFLTIHIEPDSDICIVIVQGSHRLWKIWKKLKTFSMHGKIIEFEKLWNIMQKSWNIMEKS